MFSVVSSSSYSEDGNVSEMDVESNSKKHCSSSTSKPPSKSRSGISRYNVGRNFSLVRV